MSVREEARIELVVFRDDRGGTIDMTAMWENLCDALYQIEGVERVAMLERTPRPPYPNPEKKP